MLISNEGTIHSKEEELRLLLAIICEIHLELNKNQKNQPKKQESKQEIIWKPQAVFHPKLKV